MRWRCCVSAIANGFFFAAVWGLFRTLLSSYWRLRSQLGLTRYAKAAMIEKLDAAGFDAALAPSNIGHNQARKPITPCRGETRQSPRTRRFA